eukprot:TRINITY_DN33549_c0_g1_i2.p1 TRINITY_DN33549_c0_g1~~TRINITY_DN33549_c0_g1_i2.p1  ORF type:complete len:1983 (-),score=384.47 TRINITY_DN33549_c0_g1_i2:114-6062(-)
MAAGAASCGGCFSGLFARPERPEQCPPGSSMTSSSSSSHLSVPERAALKEAIRTSLDCEVGISMQTQLGVAGLSDRQLRKRLSEAFTGSAEVEALRLEILRMEQQGRRRKQEVGSLKRALYQVRSLLVDETTPQSELGELAANQLFAEVRSEKERWNVEKRILQEQIRKMEAAIARQTSLQESKQNEQEPDPEKEALKRSLQQLQLSIDSRDRYACWVCNQESVRASWGDDEADGGAKRERGDSEDETETAALKRQIADMSRELQGLRNGTCGDMGHGQAVVSSGATTSDASAAAALGVKFSDEVSTEAVPAVRGARSSRGRVSTPFVPNNIEFSAASGGASSSSSAVRFPETVDTIEIPAVAGTRSSRGRIGTPFVSETTDHAGADGNGISASSSVHFAETITDGSGHVHFSTNVSTEEVPGVRDARPCRDRIATPFFVGEAQLQEGGSLSSTASVRFSENVETQSLPASGTMRTARGRVATPFFNQANVPEVADTEHGAGDSSVRFSTKVSVEEVAGVENARSSRGRAGTPFYAGDVDVVPATNGHAAVRFEDRVSSKEIPATGPNRSCRGRSPTPYVAEDATGGAHASDAADSRRGRDNGSSSSTSVHFSPAVDCEEIVADGVVRSSRGRVATPFVSGDYEVGGSSASTAVVNFSEDVQVEQIAGAEDARSCRGRVGTPYFAAKSEALFESPATSVRFQEDAKTINVPAVGDGRSCRGRVNTPFYSEEKEVPAPGATSASTIRFSEEVDAHQIEGVPGARASRGRVATPFFAGEAQLSDTAEASVRFSELVTTEEMPAVIGTRSSRDRVATPFVRLQSNGSDASGTMRAADPSSSSSSAQHVRFNSEVAGFSPVADPGADFPTSFKSSRDRTPTGFVSASVLPVPGRTITFANSEGGEMSPEKEGHVAKKLSSFSRGGSTKSLSSGGSSGNLEDQRSCSSDCDSHSQSSSRAPRTRLSTPFLSPADLGFEEVPTPDAESAKKVLSRSGSGSSKADEIHTPSGSESVVQRRKHSFMRKGSQPLTPHEQQHNRALIRKVSIESHVEREITERVKRSMQRQARDDRRRKLVSDPGCQSGELPQQLEGWSRVRKLVQGRRRSSTIDDTSPELDMEPRRVESAEKDIILLQECLQRLDVFDGLDEADLVKLIDTMEVYQYADMDLAVRQGDLEGSHFFIVAEGQFNVIKDGKIVIQLSKGDSFGESALLLFGERSASVRAAGNAKAYAVEGMVVRDMLQHIYEHKHEAATRAVDEVLASNSCDMLADLNAYQLQSLYDKAELQWWHDGDVLLREGQRDVDALHIVLSGFLSMQSKGVELQRLGRLAMVGDRGMVFQEMPMTVTAEGTVQTLVFNRMLLDDLFGDQLPQVLVKNRILGILAKHPVFRKLHEDQREALARGCQVQTLAPGEELEGDDIRFVACLYGEVTTSPHMPMPGSGSPISPGAASPSAQVSFRRYSATKGDCFGEDHLQNRKIPWDIRVRCAGGSFSKLAVWRSHDLDRVLTFDDLDQALLLEDKMRTLRTVFLFRTLSSQQLQDLAKRLQVICVKMNQPIFRQGDIGNDFYIIREGLVLVEIQGKKIRNLGMKDYFGERALLHHEPRSATVMAVEDCELWKMTKEMFQEIITGPIREYMKERIEMQNTTVTFKDLEYRRVIGRGGFGVVKMVRHKATHVRYALKCVRKQAVVDKEQTDSLVSERSILAEVDHPFIVKFVRSFRSPLFVYFLQELVRGGELLDVLETLGLLNHEQAQFYTASIVLALEFLHARRIAYLDLKSENCLVDHQGYLKIIDFGIAQRITMGRCHVVKGTPMFMAPEMILSKGYNTSADLWSLGICLYEFLIGEFPFGSNSKNPVEIFQEVVKAELRFPQNFIHHSHAKESISLVKGLLTRDPMHRFGAGADGYNAFREHGFFRDFSWDDLLGRRLTPPHVPKTETYAEDKALDNNASPGEDPQWRALEEEEHEAHEEAAKEGWIDPNPGWDIDFAS